MTDKECREALKELILKTTEMKEEDFSFSLLLREELGLESFLLVNLLCLAEDRFGVTIAEADVPYIRRVEDLYESVRSAKKE